MEFTIPTKETMTTLYQLVKELFEKKFFDFIDKLGQRIFFIDTEEASFVTIISPNELKIDIFFGQEGFLSCHNLLSGDTSAVFSYGISSLSVEPTNDNVYGNQYYSENFEFYKDNEKSIGYISHKPFQKPLVVNNEEALLIIEVLKRLLVISAEFQLMEFSETFEEEMVFIFTFNKDMCFDFNYMSLNNFDFYPNMNGSLYDEYGLLKTIETLNVVPGILHIGQVDSFKNYEICNNVKEFEIGLNAIFFYSMTEEGHIEHIIYASPKEDYNRIFMYIASTFLKDKEVYDTIITDNLFVYFALFDTLSDFGITVKYEPNNDFNVFITKLMIKMIQMDDDIEVIDELINSSKAEIKEILLDNLDHLSDFNERFLLPFDEIISEEDEEELFEFDDEDDNEGYVS